ncbi:MAG: FAD:protein FMN transferase [Frankiales bacterium]|nr:FAD:protein FMN transferase [Frankiales bacterium]
MTTRSTTFDLWGGTATVATVGTGSHEQAVDVVRAWLAEVDAAASTYREDSELSRLNAAAGEPVRVGPVLAEALRVALRAAERTAGAVDPTVGTVTLRGAGPSLRRSGSHRDVLLTDDPSGDGSGALVVLPAGLRLDLGATAKAWAADRAADAVLRATGLGALVSLAGDLAIAGPSPAGGWSVLVTDDHREGVASANAVAQRVSLAAGGLATSSTTVRRRTTPDGLTVAHLVDPLTWRPVDPVWRTVSVAAGDCVTANTASTAAVVLASGAVDWLRTTGLPCRLVATDGSITRLGSWPAPDAQGVPA